VIVGLCQQLLFRCPCTVIDMFRLLLLYIVRVYASAGPGVKMLNFILFKLR